MDGPSPQQLPSPNRFRDVNEQIRARIDLFDGAAGSYPLMCECESPACEDMVEIPRTEYDHARSKQEWFIVLADHTGSKRPVERRPTHWIVA